MSNTKISNFPVAASVSASDRFTFISNNQNYTITYDNFKSGLGVTGQIKPSGASTSVSILNKPSSTLNYIRGIEASQGITATLSPSDGVSIKTNLANAGAGEGIISDATAAQIELKSLVAGSGIGITGGSDTITIASTATAVTRSDSLLSLSSNATETTTAVGVPALVAGSWSDQRSSQFTNSSAGRATFNGGVAAVVPITVSATASMASGADKQIKLYIALNGSVITGSAAQGTCSASQSVDLTSIWQLEVTSGDYVEAFIENVTDSVNVVVSDAVLRIN